MWNLDTECRFDLGLIQHREWGTCNLRWELVRVAGVNLAFVVTHSRCYLLCEVVPRAYTLIREVVDTLIALVCIILYNREDKHRQITCVCRCTHLVEDHIQCRALGSKAQHCLEEVVSKLHESGILTYNLSVAITAAERNNAISEFESAIDTEPTESFWQEWFSRNKWVLGSEYLNILPDRDIDTRDIADYLMRSIDGFLDIVEIKRPDLTFWAGPDSHGNYYPSSQLTMAISQCLNYLYRIELQSNSVEFTERVDGTKTVKPQCMLVFGRSDDWGEDKLKALRILNAAHHQLHIITYDQLLLRAKQLLGLETEEESQLPF